jgi:hypothetical protein
MSKYNQILTFLLFHSLAFAHERIEFLSGTLYIGEITDVAEKIIKMSNDRIFGLNIINKITTDDAKILDAFRKIYPIINITDSGKTYILDVKALDIVIDRDETNFWSEYSIQFDFLTNSVYKYEIVNFLRLQKFDFLVLQFLFSGDDRFKNIGFGMGAGVGYRIRGNGIAVSMNRQWNHSETVPDFDSRLFLSAVYSNSSLSARIIPQFGYRYRIHPYKHFDNHGKNSFIVGIGIHFYR